MSRSKRLTDADRMEIVRDAAIPVSAVSVKVTADGLRRLIQALGTHIKSIAVLARQLMLELLDQQGLRLDLTRQEKGVLQCSCGIFSIERARGPSGQTEKPVPQDEWILNFTPHLIAPGVVLPLQRAADFIGSFLVDCFMHCGLQHKRQQSGRCGP